jgi:hypothetical protein
MGMPDLKRCADPGYPAETGRAADDRPVDVISGRPVCLDGFHCPAHSTAIEGGLDDPDNDQEPSG